MLPGAASCAVIRGRVVDAETGAPIPGADIRLAGTRSGASAGGSGGFILPSVDPGTHLFRVSHIGYADLEYVVSIDSSGQPDAVILKMKRTSLKLEGIIVTADRSETKSARVPHSVSTLDREALDNGADRTVPEALAASPGVWVQKTNHGGGSPFIRGLTGNQVLVLVDGIRLNNSTFRYGPNQYLNTVDPSMVERIEVMRGAGSVLYGSDALGGVVQIFTEVPGFSSSGVDLSAETLARFMSDGMEKRLRLEVEAATTGAAVRCGAGRASFGDLVAGEGLGIESPSGYDELTGDASAVFRLSSRHTVSAAYHYLRQDDVPRFDQVAERGYSKYSFDPQVRILARAGLHSDFPTPFARRTKLTVYAHNSEEGRVKQKEGSHIITEERDEVDSRGASFEVLSSFGGDWRAVSGLEGWFDRVGSFALDRDVETGAETEKRGLYPDGAEASGAGLFTHHSFDAGKLRLTAGVRLAFYSIAASDTLFGDLHITPHAFVGHTGAVYPLTRENRIYASAGTGFRAPNINDMSSFGKFDFGVEVPSPDLSPEKSFNIEAGWKGEGSRWRGSAAFFWTRLNDLIDRVPTVWNGADSLDGDKVYMKRNVGRGRIDGCEFSFGADLFANMSIYGHLTYTFGVNETTGDPLRRMPPLNGSLELRYRGGGGVRLAGVFRAAGDQDRLAPGDVDDYRIPDGGTPGWSVLDLSAGLDRRHYRFQLDALNIFNEAYRVHGSGVDGYGCSLRLTCIFRI